MSRLWYFLGGVATGAAGVIGAAFLCDYLSSGKDSGQKRLNEGESSGADSDNAELEDEIAETVAEDDDSAAQETTTTGRSWTSFRNSAAMLREDAAAENADAEDTSAETVADEACAAQSA